MKYEYSEAAATFAMLGAIVSVGLWILQLTYSETFFDNLLHYGWLLMLGGVLYFIHSAITDHIKRLKMADNPRREE